MKTYKIVVVETNTFEFCVSAESDAEALDIARGSWETANSNNNKLLTDADADFFTYLKSTQP